MLAALTLLLLAGSAVAQERRTLVNQKDGFQVSYPAEWKVQRVKHPDPFPKIEDIKAGRAKLSLGGNSGGGLEPEDWNAVWFNQTRSGPPPTPGVSFSFSVPSVLVYAHPAAAMSFDEFTAYLKWVVSTTGMEVVSAAKVKTADGMEGYGYVYRFAGGMMPTRLVVFFKNGKRYGLTYPEMDQKDFDRLEQLFHKLVASFRVLKTGSGGQTAK